MKFSAGAISPRLESRAPVITSARQHSKNLVSAQANGEAAPPFASERTS